MPLLCLQPWSKMEFSTSMPKEFTDALGICRQAIDSTLAITRRVKAQHTLRTASLVFVQGLIAAADACLIISCLEGSDYTAAQETNLRILDNALSEMSDTWAVAGYARTGLQNLLREDGRIESPSASNTSPNSEDIPSPKHLGYGLLNSGDVGIPPASAGFQLPTHDVPNQWAWDGSLLIGEFPQPWKLDASSEHYDGGVFVEEQHGLTGFELLGNTNIEEIEGMMYS
ncbi:hypothetical protein B0J14DRAFT_24873 [Halenospora varia]|nr:hypothetical protein B0J14DRAFT_24873 [Halenospora varia]